MILKSIRLHNIRSYSMQKIDFPIGSVLLAGDIGTGKSTILLAIEFALFGLKAGELSGSALLRHGCREGSVEIQFSIGKKEITAKRTLKRTKDRIGQSAGYIIENSVKTDLMPKELRARILEILNYPSGLISKSQDLIYRFTVYTPQEEMKRIIYENKDSRLDTLRKVFNIDKYKRIKENIIIYSKFLKERKNRLEGKISDLGQKKAKKRQLSEQKKELKGKEDKASESLKAAKEETKAKKIQMAGLEEEIKEFNRRKKEFELLGLELKNIVEKREADRREIAETEQALKKLGDELDKLEDISEINRLYAEKEKSVSEKEKELAAIRNEKSQLSGQSSHIRGQVEKIKSLEKCPLCLQKVPHEHKEKILSKSNCSLEKFRKEFDNLAKKEKKLDEQVMDLKKGLKEISEKVADQKALQLKKENQVEKEKRLNFLRQGLDSSKKRIAEINSKKIELNRAIEGSQTEKRYSEQKECYERLLQAERKAELEKNSLSKELEVLDKHYKEIEEEIKEKEESEKQLKKIKGLVNWIEERFIKLVTNIEKHVMLTVYHEFNGLFRQWCSMLIEDENLNVRLDDTFSVIVEQDGYDTAVENLSGGEKTSIALAYRLALNKVINDVVSQIKTKDILILDEPTEGFSTAQLDRVRDVIDELNVRQILIVSHETKIESFVDSIIRISKAEGMSEVA
ncbi:hypothetical protein GF323_01440 [Candidatus Woesearchaeota archaeon]|nr:hypothetical protein [Candidatus Woesearchaeota archaeon]